MDLQLLKGDCLEWISKLPKASVDLIFCDPPFGKITEGKLKEIDRTIPLDRMWEAFKHVLKPSGTVLWFGTQPYISQVVCSNLDWFRYDLIWQKTISGFLNCNNRPMREHQQINVFSERSPGYFPREVSKGSGNKRDRSIGIYNGLPKAGNLYKADNPPRRVAPTLGVAAMIDPECPAYNAQLLPGKPYLIKRKFLPDSNCYRYQNPPDTINNGVRYPGSILTHKQAGHKNIHPFEKPLSLCEWLIRTYSNEGMTVLDPTFGGGSSGVVCRALGRRFIGIERDEQWFKVGSNRIYSTAAFVHEKLNEQFGD